MEMTTKRLLGGAVAVSALLVGSVAMADPQLTERPESLRAMGPANPSTIVLENAAAQIEGKTGGRVMDIRFYDETGHPTYMAVIAKGGVVDTVRLDGVNGRITRVSGAMVPDWAMSWERRADVNSARQATVPLASAIITAENAARAPAIEAGLAKPLTAQNSVLAYNVEVLMHGRPELVAVDANTNEIIANPNALGLADREPDFILPGQPIGG